ncbi:fimbrial biogenesis chaperone [Parvularcula dongshanensis]|uniref:P pilus assembly chaperone PapD n=1 Tax=Parvularcula dongshanensis TaxID=1173995 RepID=A0A840I4I1_9PROT|nr:fimbria/pilus periplasmic chaperone [Parvularcula dongshanensis]MBB4658930.1 P pilus assembly chaperone PapD [Parvularcula dongshanensis]
MHATRPSAIVRILLAAGAVMIAAGSMLSAQAHSVQPMRFDLRPSGSGSQTTLTVENTRAYPITLEILVDALTFGEDGEEVLTSSEDDFLVFPPQMMIEPGKTQSVRVRYIGDPTIKESRAYRIHVNQIPVDLTGEQRSGVALAVNFATLVNVVPAGAKPKVVASAVEEAPGGYARLSLMNEGKAYARLLDMRLALTANGERQVYDGKAMEPWLNGASNLMLPGTQRELIVPLPDGFTATNMEVALLAQ